MRNKDFCVFILSHGRADNLKTYDTLIKSNYSGPLYILIDNEDKTRTDYENKFGNKVIVFDKKEQAKTTDTADNLDKRNAVVYARNAVFNVSKVLGYKYFLVLDDDYTSFLYRFADGSCMIKNIDTVFDLFIDFMKNTPTTSIAFAQGGDFIGGFDEKKPNIKRKAMNSFFCSTEREFYFMGRINEDVNAYVYHGSVGKIFFTLMNIQLNQFITQTNKSGLTDIYLELGTYVKSFYTIIYSPSCVKISTMGRSNRRLHHSITWDNAVPCIISEKYKKL